MDPGFKGKTALVTGAGRGIGRVVCLKLANLGASVIALSKTQENLDSLKSEIPDLRTVCVDVGDWSATRAALQNIGPVDLLVNNAAVASSTPFETVTEESLDKHYAVNVKSVVNVSQVVVKGMKERGTGGSIVNVSSQASLISLLEHAAYGASKAAVDSLTKLMALELGPSKIRVNAVNPTVVMTDMSRARWSVPEKRDPMINRIPLRRFAEPEEVADSIIYLLSDQSSMVNGLLLRVDGGATV